jgi:hypothetical protein
MFAEEGRRKKEEGRKKKEEGRRKKISGFSHSEHSNRRERLL